MYYSDMNLRRHAQSETEKSLPTRKKKSDALEELGQTIKFSGFIIQSSLFLLFVVN